MEEQSKKKITWEIKNFSLVPGEVIDSDEFLVGGYKWRLRVCEDLEYSGYFFYCLEVADYMSLPSGWERHARYLIYPVNQNSATHTEQNEEEQWFDENSPYCFIRSSYKLDEICDKDSGFLVNGVLKIVAEIEVLEVIDQLDVTKKTSTIMEDVNGFQLLSPQVELATHMFERHPEIASELRTKNPNLRTGCMSLLLSLIEALRHSPRELQKADLAVAHALLGFVTEAGFKLDWLEKILDEISHKNEKAEAGESRMQEIENELKDLKMKCSDLEAELKKEKEQVSAAKAPFSFDDVI